MDKVKFLSFLFFLSLSSMMTGTSEQSEYSQVINSLLVPDTTVRACKTADSTYVIKKYLNNYSLQNLRFSTFSQNHISIPEVKKRHAITKIVTLTAITASAVATATAYYYMSEANSTYNLYLYAGNPEDMNRYFNQAESFDRKAGYSFMIFEISFFVTLFSFFISLIP